MFSAKPFSGILSASQCQFSLVSVPVLYEAEFAALQNRGNVGAAGKDWVMAKCWCCGDRRHAGSTEKIHGRLLLKVMYLQLLKCLSKQLAERSFASLMPSFECSL